MRHYFDIGANIGQTFDWLPLQKEDYRDCVFWCFEASPRHFAALISKVQSLSVQVRICPFAIADSNGVMPLLEKDDPMGDSLYPHLAAKHKPKNILNGYGVTVAVKSLPDVILGLTQPGDEIILDIDAEGCEYGMLNALLKSVQARRRVKRIMVEFHFIDEIQTGREAKEKKRLMLAYEVLGVPLEIRGCVP